MSDTLEMEESDDATSEAKKAVEAGKVRSRRTAPWMWLVMAVVAVGLAVGIWFLLTRRSRAAARQQLVPESETSSSLTTLSPEQRAAIAVEVAQTATPPSG